MGIVRSDPAGAAPINWAVDADGNFGINTNWSPAQVPLSGDDATIDRGAVAVTVTNTGVNTVNTLSTGSKATVTLTGGTFAINNGGTNAGTITVNDQRVLFLGGTLNNTGQIQLNSAGNSATLQVRNINTGVEDVTTLSGTGSVVLGGGITNVINASDNADRLVNDTGHTIKGGGQIGQGQLFLTNKGKIEATTGAGITINTTGGSSSTVGLVNTGTMQANGATLTISDSNVNNSGGTIQAITANSVVISNSRVTGGTLASSGGGNVLLESLAIIGDLTVAAGATVQVDDNRTAFLSGTITNQGTIKLNSAGNPSQLVVENATAGVDTVTLTGTGVMTTSNTTANRLLASSAEDRIINDTGHTIRGAATIGANQTVLENKGLIESTQSSGITINTTGTKDNATATLINTGTLQANGATLTISNSKVDNTGGTIQGLAGSSVVIGDSRVTGGTLTSSGGGNVLLDNNAVIGNLTVAAGGTVQVEDNRTAYLSGTITNQGTIKLNSVGNLSQLIVENATAGVDTVTLTGTGVMTTSNTTANRLLANSAEDRIVNDTGHTIRGAATIGANQTVLENKGLIEATQSSGITIDTTGTKSNATATLTNTGTLQANGGTLTITGSKVDNTGGIIHAANGSSVVLTNSHISSGSLTTAGTGTIILQGADQATNPVLHNLTITTGSSVVIQDNNSAALQAGTITNNGTIRLDSVGNSTRLRVDNQSSGVEEVVTLTGTGAVEMGNSTGNNISSINAEDRLVNDTSHTIRGAGDIGNNSLMLTNKGLIEATKSTELRINTTNNANLAIFGMINDGTVRTNGGNIRLQDSRVDNTNGVFLAQTGNTIFMDDSTVKGGQLQTTGTGLIALNNNTVFDNLKVTSGSNVQLQDNRTSFFAPGTLTNDGTIKLNSAGNNTTFAVLSATGGEDSVLLTGSGQITMTNTTANRLTTQDGLDRIINDTSHTIRGSGQIGANFGKFENRGLVDANQSQDLIINTTGFANDPATAFNTGTLQSSASGTLRIQETHLNNAAGTIQALDTSSVIIDAARVDGGTFKGGGSGSISLVNFSTLNGVTIDPTGVLKLGDNQTATLIGTITNNGAIQMNSAGNNTQFSIADLTNGVQDIVRLEGTGTLTMTNTTANRLALGFDGQDRFVNGTGHTIQGSGQIGASTVQIFNEGKIIANQGQPLIITPQNTGLVPVPMTNTATGVMMATNNATMSLAQFRFLNEGTYRAENGGNITMSINSTLDNNVGGTLTGGIFQAVGNGSTITLAPGANISTNAADIYLVNAGSNIKNFDGSLLDTTLHTNNGSLRIQDGRSFTATANSGNFTNNGLLELASGNGTATFKGNTSLTNTATGTITGYGTVDNRVTNSGTIDAILGTLTVNGGATGTGTLRADGATATLNLSNATQASNALLLDLTNGGRLNVGTQNVNVSGDYTNGAFGVGNAFNNRANVTGTGLILATGDVGVSVSGTGVSNGTTTTPTLALGNVHVGSSNAANLNINNTGTTGPVLRGAVQNTNITNPALGVTAQNFGPIALGGSSPIQVAFNPNSAGALASQSFRVVTNFDNVGPQTVSVTGAAYDYANPVVQNAQPIAFGNVHVGQAVATQNLSIQNQVITNAAFQEALNASAGAGTNGVTVSGSFNGLAAGNTNNSGVQVGINTATAGSRNGTATVNFVSDGTGTSGLGQTPLAAQQVNVTGGVYDLAKAVISPNPVNVGNFHTGASGTQALSIQNQVITNAGFQEGLNASAGTTTGAAVSNSGSFSNLAAGGTNNNAITVGLNAATSGAQSGTVTVNLVSNGTGTSGLGNTNLASQVITVSGTAYNLANPTLGTINLGVLHTNTGTQSVGLSVTNALIGNASFQEGLNASFGTYTNSGTISPTFSGSLTNLAAGQTNSTSMTASVNTNTSGVGVISGNVLVNLISNGSISGLGNTSLAGQLVAVSGSVTATITNEAIPVVNNSLPVNFGNVRINSAVAPVGLSITNGAPIGPFTEGLIAAVAGTFGTGITASGSFGSAGNALAPQATDNGSIQVGIDTSSAGAKSGAARINFQSDGTPFGGSVTNIQPFPTDVAVQGNVYRLANPTLNTASVNLAARVGDASPTANVGVTNTSPDIYTEGLKANISPVAAGFSNAGGAINNLAAGGTDGTTLKVGLNTGTSGTFSGQAQVNFTSTGAGTTGAPDQALPSQNVALNGKVYQTAATATTGSVNFGTVHVGDSVATRAVSVTNTAAGALVDVITGGFGAVSSPFSGSGNLGAGVAAGNTSNALLVGLNTASAGTFNGNASLSLSSHNPDLADVSLAAGPVALSATVNNYAVAALGKSSGAGAFSGSGSAYTLNLGDITVGGTPVLASLFATNAAPAGLPADLMQGVFSVFSGGGFDLSGFDPFADLAAGDLFSGLEVSLNPVTLGQFQEVIDLAWFGTNPDYEGDVNHIFLTLTANVTQGGNTDVPEPPAVALMLISLLGFSVVRLRRMHARPSPLKSAA